MAANVPAIRVMSPNEFRPVLKAMVGMPVWAAQMKTYELFIGRKHTIKLHSLGPRPDSGEIIEQDFPDLTLALGNEWAIVKQGRIVDHDDGKPRGWFKDMPNIGSLVDLQIVDVVLDSGLGLCVTFADDQRLLTDNQWYLSTLLSRSRYQPTSDGNIQLTALNDTGDIGAYAKSLSVDSSS